MSSRRAPQVAGITAVAVALLLLNADSPPTFSTRQAWVLSNFEASGHYKLVRDCGFSQPLPGSASQSLWVFCDTVVHSAGRRLPDFIPGSTAARGPQSPGEVPRQLNELPTPPAAVSPASHDGGPEMFLRQPTDLYRRDGNRPRTSSISAER